METLNNWKRTSDFTLYWLERKQLRARLDTQESCSDYAENVLREQTATLTTNFQSTTLPHAIDTRSVTPDSVEFTPSNVIYRHDDVEDSRSSPSPTTTLRSPTVEREDDSPASLLPTASASSSRDINAGPVVPWMFNDSNVAELFQTFQHKVSTLSRANLLQIETSIHEISLLYHHHGKFAEQSEQTEQTEKIEHFLQHKASIFVQWRIKHLRENTCEIFYYNKVFF